jgi:Phosphatidate cytidylyltransferase, mitochondrial
MDERLLDIVAQVFPPTHFDYTNNIVYAFGYGSGVVSQHHHQQPSSQPSLQAQPSPTNSNTATITSSSTTASNLVDLILVVQNVHAFHTENIRYNLHHYNYNHTTSTSNKGTRKNPCVDNENANANANAAVIHTRAQEITWIQCHNVKEVLPYPFHTFWSNPGLYFHLVEDIDNINHSTSTQKSRPSTSSMSQQPSMQGIKYGIVQCDTLLYDLQQWSHLYLAGRMHKPIVPIPLHPLRKHGITWNHNTSTASSSSTRTIETIQQQIESSQQCYNLPAAVATALLYHWYNHNNHPNHLERNSTTTSTIVLRDLYTIITNLSYSGDPRMNTSLLNVRWEDPNKVHNIVTAQYTQFHTLYTPILQSMLLNQNIRHNDPRPTASTVHLFDSIDYNNTSSDSMPLGGLLLNQNGTDTTTTTTTHETVLRYNWDHPEAHERLWQYIPDTIRQHCRKAKAPPPTLYTLDTAANVKNQQQHHHSDQSNLNEYHRTSIRQLQQYIAQRIVAPASQYQSLKGLYSTGLRKSIQYVYRKFLKGRTSPRRIV